MSDDPDKDGSTRRGFLNATAITGAGLFVAGCSGMGGPGRQGGAAGEEEEVWPAEDLMREHGVLKRVLLVYSEAVARIDQGRELPPDTILDAAQLIRSFVEDYHEKLEEDYLFPRFRKASTQVELVEVLKQQHEGGRKLTDITLRYANARSLKEAEEKKQLRDSLASFIRMYNPHEAREDTVLFPAFRKIVSPHEYAALGEDFEKREHQLFGRDGFESMVARVVRIEQAMGIYDLGQFTPKV